MLLEPGQVYGGKYRIVKELGAGSMGAVYEGENAFLHRRVAIKALHPGIASKAEVVERFEREAQAAGRIGSEHIVEVLDMGDLPDGTRYLVMEYLEGTTLEDRIRSKGRLKPEDACPLVVQLLDGLEAAHAAGIIHRDLKPANVFITHQKGAGRDFVKILDFGISKFNVLNEEMSMTRTGMVLGTPYYMSPEQAKGSREVDPRSDLYAVGVILYEGITGQLPFSAETFNELLFRIVLESPPPAETYVPDLDPEFAAIIRKAMAREPNERFQAAGEFRDVLSDWLRRHQPDVFVPVNQTVMIPGGQLDGGPTRMLMAPAVAPAPYGSAEPLQSPAHPVGASAFEGGQEPQPGLSASVPAEEGGQLAGAASRSALLGAFAGIAVIGGILGGVVFWRNKAAPGGGEGARTAEPRLSETKPSEAKPAEAKPLGVKPSEAGPPEARAAGAEPPLDPKGAGGPTAEAAGGAAAPELTPQRSDGGSHAKVTDKPGGTPKPDHPAKPDKAGGKASGAPAGTAAPAATASPAATKAGGRVVSSDL